MEVMEQYSSSNSYLSTSYIPSTSQVSFNFHYSPRKWDTTTLSITIFEIPKQASLNDEKIHSLS